MMANERRYSNHMVVHAANAFLLFLPAGISAVMNKVIGLKPAISVMQLPKGT